MKFIKKTFSPQKIILFGSRARGDNLKESDIDLLIISSKFNNIPFMDRLSKAYGKWDKKIDLEQICLTPEEFNKRKKEIGIINQASKEGIDILKYYKD